MYGLLMHNIIDCVHNIIIDWVRIRVRVRVRLTVRVWVLVRVVDELNEDRIERMS